VTVRVLLAVALGAAVLLCERALVARALLLPFMGNSASFGTPVSSGAVSLEITSPSAYFDVTLEYDVQERFVSCFHLLR